MSNLPHRTSTVTQVDLAGSGNMADDVAPGTPVCPLHLTVLVAGSAYSAGACFCQQQNQMLSTYCSRVLAAKIYRYGD